MLPVELFFDAVERPARPMLALPGSQGHNATFLDELREHRLTLGETERGSEDFFEGRNAILVQYRHTA